MNDPRRNLPQTPQALTLDEASMEACMDEINVSLKKYNCNIIFLQMHQNGMPVDGGMIQVIKNKSLTVKDSQH